MKAIFLLALIGSIFTSCSTANNRKLDDKLFNETNVNSRSDLRTEAKSSIDNAVNLTNDQKEKLTELRRSVNRQSDEFNQQSLELRAILLRDLLSAQYNPQEISLIKSRMRKLESRRLSLIFDAADKANIILGREAAINHAIMGEFVGNRDSQY